MAEFVKINRDLPHRIVTQGVEINFTYTGQPLTCYRCNSTEHVVQNCDKQHSARPTVTKCLEASGGGEPSLDPLYQPRQQKKTLPRKWTTTLRKQIWKLQSQPLSYAQVSDPSEDLSPSLSLGDLFNTCLIKETAPVVTGEIRQS